MGHYKAINEQIIATQDNIVEFYKQCNRRQKRNHSEYKGWQQAKLNDTVFPNTWWSDPKKQGNGYLTNHDSGEGKNNRGEAIQGRGGGGRGG